MFFCFYAMERKPLIDGLLTAVHQLHKCKYSDLFLKIKENEEKMQLIS